MSDNNNSSSNNIDSNGVEQHDSGNIPEAPKTPPATKDSYYSQGSTEVATESLLTMKRLETRRKLTRNCHRLVLVLVGLPARGKSFLARKLQAYLTWYGTHCKIFNVGKYRREAYAQLIQHEFHPHLEANNHQQKDDDPAEEDNHDSERLQTGACDANFFDPKNTEAAALREQVAEVALRDMLRWLDEEIEDDEDGETTASDEFDDVGNSRHSTIDSSLHSRTTTVSARAGIQRDNTWVRDRIAIFDATNSTAKRRQWLLEECTSPTKRKNKATGLVFVESVCDDAELLEQNFNFKVANSPDFKGMTTEEAIEDLKRRVEKYEAQYETINDDSQSYIKVFNLSTKLLVNHVYGRLSKIVVPALMAWNIGTRPVFLCRPGETPYGVVTDGEDYVASSGPHANPIPHHHHFPSSGAVLDLSASQMDVSSGGTRRNRTNSKSVRAYSLGVSGKKFSDALLEFLAREGTEFLIKRASVADMRHTGTSISGLARAESLYRSESADDDDNQLQRSVSHEDNYHRSHYPTFPLKIFTSTLPRARQTVEWEQCDFFRVEEFSNLNPLDKGDLAGLELEDIKNVNPRWYDKLERDPFHTRFPGGECYRDLIRRLESVIIDIEQQVIPVLVVSHVSILQTLMAYFRNTPVEKCTSIEVPLHTVIKFTPVRGGGWIESQHPLSPITNVEVPTVTSESDMSALSANYADDTTVPTCTTDSTSSPKVSTPIWGDHVNLQRKLSEFMSDQ